MDDEFLVSVIVPVHNVAPYLVECVSSIVAQSYRNLEIILVDDGSTDGSATLCDCLAETDARIQVLHKSNGGPSEARSVGVARCRGAWVTFVDSDDVVSPFYIEVLLSAVLSANVLIASMRGVISFCDSECIELLNDYDLARNLPCKVVESAEALRLLLYQSIEAGMVYRIYNRQLLDNNLLSSDFVVGEDLLANYRLFHEAGSIVLVDTQQIYAYRQVSSSLVHKPCDHAKAASAYEVAEQLYRDITAWYPGLSRPAASRSFSICRSVFAQLPSKPDLDDVGSRDCEKLWSILSCHRSTVLRDPHARKRERLAAAIAHLGCRPFFIFCRFARSLGLLR